MAKAVGNTLRGSLGNLVEWYDVYTYTVFASYFESQFFDPEDKNSTIYVYAIFAVTFIARPIGSWFFGRYADRRGRRAALTLSVTIMAICSFIIAILPTKDMIGVWAAVMLTFLRLIQGFATGGEYATSATYMSEAALPTRRGFFSSFQYVTLVGGHVLAQLTLLIMTATMGKEQISEWGWRIAFGIGGVAAVVVFWLRRTMDESLSTEHLEAIRSGEDTQSGTLRELFANHWKPMLIAFLFTLGGTVSFYVYSITGPATVKKTFTDDPMVATWVNFIALTFLMLIQPLGGYISDRIGRKPVFLFFAIGATLWTWYFVFNLPKQDNPFMAFLFLIVSYTILCGYTSINAIFKAELFPARVRALGVGLSYGLANSLFAGTAPMLYEIAKTNDAVPVFVIYVTMCVIITLITILVVMSDKRASALDLEQGTDKAKLQAETAAADESATR